MTGSPEMLLGVFVLGGVAASDFSNFSLSSSREISFILARPLFTNFATQKNRQLSASGFLR
jgi:hypothetical protein